MDSSPSAIPTVDEWEELSAIGWGTSWEVVGSSLRTMVTGCGADQAWMQMSDEGWRQREARAVARQLERERQADREAARQARVRAEEARRAKAREAQRETAAQRRLRELRYELEAVRAGITLVEYRLTHPYGVEAFGPAGPRGEAVWYPIEMRLTSEAGALALAEHLHRTQGITTRAVHW